MKNGYVTIISLSKHVNLHKRTLLTWAKRFADDPEHPSGLKRDSLAPTSTWLVTAEWGRWVTVMVSEYVGVVEAATLLNKTRTTIFRWYKEGYLTGYTHPNGSIVYKLSDIERYIDAGLDETDSQEKEEQ